MNNLPENFNDNLAVYFNKLIEVLELKFESFEAKTKWSHEQIAKKTPYGVAAVKYAFRNA